MSLAALAIRLSTIRALQGRTLAGAAIYDSTPSPLDLIGEEGNLAPYVVVTTDDNQSKHTGNDLIGGDYELTLVIDIIIATSVRVTLDDGTETVESFIPATDAGFEITLNTLEWQIKRALQADGGPWGNLWRVMVTDIKSVVGRRGADTEKGVRYAGRQLSITVDHLQDPQPNGPPEGVWADLVSAMKADPDFASAGKILEAEITGVETLPWERMRAELGIANDIGASLPEHPLVLPVTQLTKIATDDGFEFDAAKAVDNDGPEP